MDNATFDRLARMLAGGASRRHTLRAIIAAALAGGTADALLAKKTRDKKNNDKDDKNGKDRGRDNKRGGAAANRASAQAKKTNENKKKRKRKNKRKPNNNGGGGNSCAGTPLRPGQTFLDCDFSERNLRGRDLNSSLFKDVDLTDADLCGANLESTSFTDSDASGANFTDVNFDSSSHDNTSYANANLTNATFRVATFNEVDFSNADLTGVDFTGSTLSDVGFAGAIFCRTTRADGSIDNRDCDICDNTCGLCEDCDDEDCTPPDCCPNPSGPGGICVDTATDPLNCGSCDRACFTNLSSACVDGECVCGNDPECSGNQTCCRGEGGGQTRCVNTNTDFDNCGSCGNDCPPSKADQCVAGDCVCGASPDACGLDLTCCNGDCVDTDDDFDNCGDCGADCPPNKADACTNGVCTCGGGAECLQSTTCCEGACIDTDNDFDNCGDCGDGCTPGKADACVEGGCVCGEEPQCNANQTCCPGEDDDPTTCANLSNDLLNCGECGRACIIPENPCLVAVCQNGECDEIPLPDGSACTVNSELQGICCTPEGGVPTCVPGDLGEACCTDAQCTDPEACCENQCIDVQNDLDNCGECGNRCSESLPECFHLECNQGTCETVPDEDGEPCFEGICCADTETVLCITDIDDNVDHCGGCDPCNPDTADACVNGDCVCGSGPACTGGLTCCNGQCVDTTSSPGNCGGCNQLCAAISSPCAEVQCIASQCTAVSDPEFTPCLDGQTEGICCGSGAAAICVANGVCCSDTDCGQGLTCCSGQCVDTASSLGNCGGCGLLCGGFAGPCIAGTACIGGQCQPVASDPGAVCLLDDEAGICCAENSAVICEVGGVCCDNTDCAENPDGDSCCANQCVDTQTDPDNCGGCGQPCETNETCSDGECEVCIGTVCGNDCVESPACCTVEDCAPISCMVRVDCTAERECVYENAPAETPCGFGTCDGQGNCIPPES